MKKSTEASAKRWVLALTSTASFMVSLDALIVTLALSTIRADLGASIEGLEWIVNAYNLSFAVLLMTAAALGDRWGRRRMFLTGLALFVTGSIACALSQSVAQLVAARALQGVGSAFVMPIAMALLSAAFGREERAKALGIFSGVTGLGLIAGPIVGGAVAQGLAWQWLFWINVPIGIVVFAMIWRQIGESFGAAAALDPFGLGLVTLAALGVAWGLMRGNQVGWASTEVLVVLAGGLLLIPAFILREMHTCDPMLPLRFFRSRAFSVGILTSFLFYGSLYGVLFFIAQFFQNVMGYRPLEAGLRLLPWTATLVVFAPLGGALVNRLGERTVVVVGLLMDVAGLMYVATIASPDVTYIALVGPLVLAGAGVSLAMPAAQHAVLSAVAPAEIGKASGIFNMFRFLGATAGIAANAAIFIAKSHGVTAPDFSAGFVAAVFLSTAFAFLAALAGLFLPARRAKQRSTNPL
jgi:EmrB/QacA subfamily drug resistance transporter